MINLSEYKFGDRLRTRGGLVATYIGIDKFDPSTHNLEIDMEGGWKKRLYCKDNGMYRYLHNPCRWDIVGKWEDEV